MIATSGGIVKSTSPCHQNSRSLRLGTVSEFFGISGGLRKTSAEDSALRRPTGRARRRSIVATGVVVRSGCRAVPRVLGTLPAVCWRLPAVCGRLPRKTSTPIEGLRRRSIVATGVVVPGADGPVGSPGASGGAGDFRGRLLGCGGRGSANGYAGRRATGAESGASQISASRPHPAHRRVRQPSQ
jgi:hypothetical protein